MSNGNIVKSELSRLAQMWGLAAYKKSMMNEKARLGLNFIAILITVQFFVDWLLWGRSFAYGYPIYVAVPLGFAFAFGIAMLERFVVVAKVGTSAWVTVPRGLLVLGAAAVTAIPFTLGMFESEINRRIEKTQNAAVDGIRERAIKEEMLKHDGDGTPAKPGLILEAQHEYDGDGTPAKPGLIEIERRKFEGFDSDGDGIVEPGLIAKAEKAVIDDEAGALAKAQGAYDRVKNDRATKRAQMLKPHTDAVQGFTDRFNGLQDEGTSEAAGKGKSGRYGLGSGFKAAKSAERDTKAMLDDAIAKRDLYIRDNIVAFDAETEAELAKLKEPITTEPAKAKEAAAAGLKEARTKRDLTLRDLREKRDKLVAERRKEREAKLEEVKLMDPEALSKKYGGDWKQSSGFMARYDVLHQIVEEKPSSKWLYWVCHIAMILFGFLVLMTSWLMKRDDTSKYLDEKQQLAGNGDDPGLIEYAQTQGLSADPAVRSATTMSPEIKALRNTIYLKRQAAVRAYHAWMDAVGELCTPSDGLCQPLPQHRQTMRVKWNLLVAPAIIEVGNAETALEAVGGALPPWPIAQIGHDPRYQVDADGTQNSKTPLAEPWNTVHTDDQLTHLGWTDPTELRQQIAGQMNELHNTRRAIAENVHALHALVEREIAIKPDIDYAVLRRRLGLRFSDKFHQDLRPLLNDLREREDFLRSKGQTIPQWTPGFRGTLDDVWTLSQIPSPDFLARHFGWEGVVQANAGMVPPPLNRPTRALDVPAIAPTVPNQPAVELCGACNQATPIDSEFCAHCNIRRRPPVVATQTVVCSSCNEDGSPADGTYCIHCGAPLQPVLHVAP